MLIKLELTFEQVAVVMESLQERAIVHDREVAHFELMAWPRSAEAAQEKAARARALAVVCNRMLMEQFK